MPAYVANGSSKFYSGTRGVSAKEVIVMSKKLFYTLFTGRSVYKAGISKPLVA